MASNKATIKIDCSNIGELTQKTEKLLNLLQQVKQLLGELALVDINLDELTDEISQRLAARVHHKFQL